MTNLKSCLCLVFAGAVAVSTGVFADDVVNINVAAADSTVSIAVVQTDDVIWRTTLPCRTVNLMSMDNMVGMVRGYSQDAFNERVKSKPQQETFADMMRLQTGSAIRQASAICAARSHNNLS